MRQRYQKGSLRPSSRKGGDVWEYRFRETVDGKRVERTHIVGTLKQYKTETAAWKAIELIRLNLNAGKNAGPIMSFRTLADHYSQHEMPMDNHEEKAWSTKNTNRGYLRKWVMPKWGESAISELTPVQVEGWLKTLMLDPRKGSKAKRPMQAGTKAKIRNLMSAIYRHAMRHGFIQNNPIQLVRQGSKRAKAPEILTVEEIHSLLAALRPRERTMVLLDAGSGLRRGELFGLQWGDVDFRNLVVHVQRSVVQNVVGKCKTEVSAKPMPLDEYMARDLLEWYRVTPYREADSYVFATDANRAGSKRGKQPISPAKVMTYWIQPCAKSIGITKHINWHTFRHTFTNLLHANGEDVKTVQELLRQASAKITMDVYSQAVTQSKRDAQSRVVAQITRPN